MVKGDTSGRRGGREPRMRRRTESVPQGVSEPEKWPGLILARTYAAMRREKSVAAVAAVAREPGIVSPGYNAREIAPLV